jgi:hypothetical protein
MPTTKKKPSIFISHSSKDVQIARAVRNLLEDRDHFVGFFGWLQEMTDDETRAYLDAEIKEHQWLLLVDTPNAENSKWVQFEIERARHYGKKLYAFTVSDLDTTNRAQAEQGLNSCVDILSQSLRINITHDASYFTLGRIIESSLQDAGFETSRALTETQADANMSETASFALQGWMTRAIWMPLLPARETRRLHTIANLQTRFNQVLQNQQAIIIPVITDSEGIELIENLPENLQRNVFTDFAYEDDVDLNMSNLLELVQTRRREEFTKNCGRIIE